MWVTKRQFQHHGGRTAPPPQSSRSRQLSSAAEELSTVVPTQSDASFNVCSHGENTTSKTATLTLVV